MAMTVVGFIPELDVISDAYFLGRAVVDVLQGRGSRADVAMSVASLPAQAVVARGRPITTWGAMEDR